MTTGLAVFDTTVQETNAWLNQIEAGLPPCGKQDAYQALRTVLHVLRDKKAKRGIATICIGGGLGGAMLVEVGA